MSARLRMALETGGLELPETGRLSVLYPRADMDLSDLPKDRVQIVQPVKPDHDHFARMGYECLPENGDPVAGVLVCLPRAKVLAHLALHQACQRTGGMVIVDGPKTDGIDSLLKDCRKRVAILGTISKAHGKIFWFLSDPEAFSDWQAGPQRVEGGLVTAPGAFSADGPDPASRALIAALPSNLKGRVVDLGAGWGFLSAFLKRMPGIETLDLVEADYTALACARANVPDPRARFHWADATSWTPSAQVDAVVMNPPFHVGRAADPSLGRAFIQTAARILSPTGSLWMVANRHLPYESTLETGFAKVEEIGGDSRFKCLHAQRPVRGRQPKPGKATPMRTRR